FSPDAVALKAGRILLEQIDAYASKRVDFAFETTLSGMAYLSRFKDLKKEGYAIHLFFLWVPDVKLSLARVANRVKMGGHGISEKVVRRRFYKGISNFFNQYRPVLDSWILFDGSGKVPYPIAQERAGKLKVFDQELYEKVRDLAEEK
ncbi:MAG: zeta toxin family protein, partial [Candidatus Omnitrophota bacterium]|nr:zeta toxin family protein [Candidatus Omnitrophota bacterium]